MSSRGQALGFLRVLPSPVDERGGDAQPADKPKVKKVYTWHMSILSREFHDKQLLCQLLLHMTTQQKAYA